MSETIPLVSIIISTYNRPKLIIDAIKSIQDQSYKNFEIIIDDCSSDRYPDITKLNKKISYFKSKENKGPASSKNLGMDKANGKYWCFLDDDDIICYNDHLKIAVQILEEHPEFHGVYYDCQTIKKDKLERIFGLPWKNMKKQNVLRDCAMIFRATEHRLEHWPRFEDYSLWQKFYEDNLECLYIPIVTTYYRKDYSIRSLRKIRK